MKAIEKINEFARYDAPNGETFDGLIMNHFEEYLYSNYVDKNMIIGKARQEYVTTRLAFLAYYLAFHKSKKVGIRLPKADHFRRYRDIISMCSEREHGTSRIINNKLEIEYENGGRLEYINDYRSKSFHYVIIDEIGFIGKSIHDEIRNALHSTPNIIASVTIREGNLSNKLYGGRLNSFANQTLRMLSEISHFEYLEPGVKHTMFTENDIQKYRSMI